MALTKGINEPAGIKTKMSHSHADTISRGTMRVPNGSPVKFHGLAGISLKENSEPNKSLHHLSVIYSPQMAPPVPSPLTISAPVECVERSEINLRFTAQMRESLFSFARAHTYL